MAYWNGIKGKTPKDISIDVRETVESRPGFTFLAAGKEFYKCYIICEQMIVP